MIAPLWRNFFPHLLKKKKKKPEPQLLTEDVLHEPDSHPEQEWCGEKHQEVGKPAGEYCQFYSFIYFIL